MGDLASALRDRVALARRNLRQARADEDAYEIDVYGAELEDLLRRAAAYGVAVEPSGPEERQDLPREQHDSGQARDS